MRAIAVWTIVIALLAAACGAPEAEDGENDFGEDSPVTTSPVTTSPATTSPVASDDSSTTTVAPSEESEPIVTDENDEPAGDDGGEGVVVTTQPPKEDVVKPIQPVESHPEGPAAAAVVDLAARLGIAESAVTVVSVEEVTWPDGSIGCPQPGMSYTQALVNGSLVVLQANGANYEYHAGGGRDLFYCATPTPPTTGESGDT